MIDSEDILMRFLKLRWSFALAPFCVIVAAVGLTGCGGSQGNAGVSNDNVTPSRNAWSLRATNEAGLTAYFREALGPQSTAYLNTVWAKDALGFSTAASPTGTPGIAMSGTTLQESGVDEADTIKSDGVFVFNLESGKAATQGTGAGEVLRRQRLVAGDTPKLQPVDSVSGLFSADVRGSSMYLDTDRRQVVALGEGFGSGGIYDIWFAPQFWGSGTTELALVSAAADAATMQKRRHVRINAQLIGSRRLGATLYLVLRSYPQVNGLDPAWPTAKTGSNQLLLDQVQAASLLPTYSVDGGPALALVQPSSCLVQDANTVKTADLITLVAIDLSASTHRHTARCFVGGTEAFYMSEKSLYLATTRNTYTYSGALPVYAGQTTTDVHKFALDGLDMGYRGSGNVQGHLGFEQNRKSFRMGEYQGALRVITQTDTVWGGWTSLPAPVPAATSPGRLSILQEDGTGLVVAGELPNAARPAPLGKAGEQLYASRFVGTRGYLVTYRLTDPLYVLDLSNPKDPKVAGELQVSGYSDYLFPLSETLLLGVGKDAISDGAAGDGRFAWYQGVKVSLIDVTDPAKPVESARSLIGRRGTDATVLRNHHGIALQTLGNTVRVSLPVNVHDTAPAGSKGLASDYFSFTRTELQKFEVNLATKTLSGRSALASSLSAERDISADRSLLWNDQVHYFQAGGWVSGAW
jgi:hypothetical protein